MRGRTRTAAFTLGAIITAGALTACGGTSGSSSTTTSTPPATATSASASTGRRTAAPSAQLAVAGRGSLPAPRSGGAAAALGSQIVFSGGLSSAGTSTATVFTLPQNGTNPVGATGQLPGPVHDAAEATLGGQLLLFGGGRSEGSNRIIRVLPGPAQVIGRLPQALSDLDAAVIGKLAYVIGGWDGSATNRTIYASQAGPNSRAVVESVGHLPLGVRYPAAAPLAGRMIIAGGEITAGTPTAAAWSFDPATGNLIPLPSLPVPTDHAPGAVLNGRFYLLGGLRRGSFSSAIVSWAPGERRWRSAGRLPTAISDAAAVSLPDRIAVLGGRGAGGTVATVTWLAAKRS